MVLILCGKSGCGKDALEKEFVSRGYTPLVSYTTRPKRLQETEGVEYHFIGDSEFRAMLDAGKILEYRSYTPILDGEPREVFYGTPYEDLNKGTLYVKVLDVRGAKAFLDAYGRENCFVVYVTVSDDIRRVRAMNRLSFDEAEWNRRLKTDAYDFTLDKVAQVANITVSNERNLCYCANEIESACMKWLNPVSQPF